VCACRAGARDRDVRQRREVVDRKTGGIESPAEVAVARAATDRDRRALRVDLEDPRHSGKRDELTARVGDVVERVPGAEGAQPAGAADNLLEVLERLRLVKPGRRVGIVPGPVPELAHWPTVAPLPRRNLDSSRWPDL